MSSEAAIKRSNAHCPCVLETLLLTTQLLSCFPFPSNCFYSRAISPELFSLRRARLRVGREVSGTGGNDSFFQSLASEEWGLERGEQIPKNCHSWRQRVMVPFSGLQVQEFYVFLQLFFSLLLILQMRYSQPRTSVWPEVALRILPHLTCSCVLFVFLNWSSRLLTFKTFPTPLSFPQQRWLMK